MPLFIMASDQQLITSGNLMDDEALQLSAAQRRVLENPFIHKLLDNGEISFQDALHSIKPLIIAARAGYTTLVKVLLGLQQVVDGINHQAEGVQDRTALYQAAAYGRADIVRLLLAAGADLRLARTNGCTALMIAAQESETAVVEVMLVWAKAQLQFDPEKIINQQLVSPNQDPAYAKKTAFHFAAERGHDAILELFYRFSVDDSLMTGSGHTALQLAESAGHAACITLQKTELLTADSVIHTALSKHIDRMNESGTAVNVSKHKKMITFAKSSQAVVASQLAEPARQDEDNHMETLIFYRNMICARIDSHSVDVVDSAKRKAGERVNICRRTYLLLYGLCDQVNDVVNVILDMTDESYGSQKTTAAVRSAVRLNR